MESQTILWIGKGINYSERLLKFYNALKEQSNSIGKAFNALSGLSSSLRTKFDTIYVEDKIYPGPRADGPLTEFDKREPRNSYQIIMQIRNNTINRKTNIYVIQTHETDTRKFLEAGATDFIEIEKIPKKGLEKFLTTLQQNQGQ